MSRSERKMQYRRLPLAPNLPYPLHPNRLRDTNINEDWVELFTMRFLQMSNFASYYICFLVTAGMVTTARSSLLQRCCDSQSQHFMYIYVVCSSHAATPLTAR